VFAVFVNFGVFLTGSKVVCFTLLLNKWVSALPLQNLKWKQGILIPLRLL